MTAPWDKHAETASSLDMAIAQMLDTRVCPAQPGDAALLARVRSRVLQAIGAEPPAAEHVTVRADEGVWEELAPGLKRKRLHEAGGAVSVLLRLAPGTVVAGHAHALDEECLVLEGTLRIGRDLLLRAGDFHVGREGVVHADASTDTGALVYLRGARPDLEAENRVNSPRAC